MKEEKQKIGKRTEIKILSVVYASYSDSYEHAYESLSHLALQSVSVSLDAIYSNSYMDHINLDGSGS
jgi:transposase